MNNVSAYLLNFVKRPYVWIFAWVGILLVVFGIMDIVNHNWLQGIFFLMASTVTPTLLSIKAPRQKLLLWSALFYGAVLSAVVIVGLAKKQFGWAGYYIPTLLIGLVAVLDSSQRLLRKPAKPNVQKVSLVLAIILSAIVLVLMSVGGKSSAWILGAYAVCMGVVIVIASKNVRRQPK
jgi:hypothetical protein